MYATQGHWAPASGLTVYQTSFGQEWQSVKGWHSLPSSQPSLSIPSDPEEMLPGPAAIKYGCCLISGALVTNTISGNALVCCQPSCKTTPQHFPGSEGRLLSRWLAKLVWTTLLPPTAHQRAPGPG